LLLLFLFMFIFTRSNSKGRDNNRGWLYRVRPLVVTHRWSPQPRLVLARRVLQRRFGPLRDHHHTLAQERIRSPPLELGKQTNSNGSGLLCRREHRHCSLSSAFCLLENQRQTELE